MPVTTAPSSSSEASSSAVPAAASTSTSVSDAPATLKQTSGGRVSGKFWKEPKTATRRTHLPAGVKTPWDIRVEQRKKADATKQLERELKAEKEQEAERKKQAHKERKERVEEKKRLEEMAAKMSAKKLQRMKKRMGRSKAING